MEVVSENSEEGIRAQRAADELRHTARVLLANLLRLYAGGGKGHELNNQIYDFVLAWAGFSNLSHEYRQAPWAVVAEAISNLDWRRGNPSYTAIDRGDRVEVEISRASARFMAACLLAQPTQEAAAHNQMFDAVRDFVKLYPGAAP